MVWIIFLAFVWQVVALGFLAMSVDRDSGTCRGSKRVWIGMGVGLLGISLVAGSSMPAYLAVVLGSAVPVAGILLLCRGVGLSADASQCIGSLILILMWGLVFYANPFVEAASGAGRTTLINQALAASPLVGLLHTTFGHDLLHGGVLYRFSVIPFYPYLYPGVIGHLVLWLPIGLLTGIPGWWLLRRSCVADSADPAPAEATE